MSVQDAVRPTFVRDPSSGLPILATVGEVQTRALVERGQAVVQELRAQIEVQAHVINRMRAAFAVLLLEEAHDELMEFDFAEFEKIDGREIDEQFLDTPDGRKLWRVFLRGEKANAALARNPHGLRVVKGGA